MLHITVMVDAVTAEMLQAVVNIVSHIVLQVAVGSAVPTEAIASLTQLLGSVIAPPAHTRGGVAWHTLVFPALPAWPALPL